jgi:hypothetical protein
MTGSRRNWLILVAVFATLSVGLRNPDPAPPQGLISPISMTIQNNRLFVSDRVTGIHVFDVADPVEPFLKMTIPLRGNRGTAIKDDILYANEWGSLLAIRVDADTFEVVKTIKRDPAYIQNSGFAVQTGGFACACASQPDAVLAPAGTGTGSSFATFAVIDDYLYYLDYSTLVTLDISQPADPKEISQTQIGWDVETLYPTADYLFVGGARGMYIFDRSDPAAPDEVGRVEHFRACDPVVVSGDVAYVTLRGGSRCGAAPDVLLCVSIHDPSRPIVLGEKPMKTPYGLAIDATHLYVSTGENGYELFDVSEPWEPTRLNAWDDRPTRDFVWMDRILYALTFDGLLIFDASNPREPVLLSELRSETD